MSAINVTLRDAPNKMTSEGAGPIFRRIGVKRALVFSRNEPSQPSVRKQKHKIRGV